MHVHRTKQAAHFTVLPNGALQDDGLSFGARGLLGFLLSLPDGTPMSIRVLAETQKGGRQSIAAALRELASAGYYLVKRIKQGNGRIISETYVFDTPQPEPGNPASGSPEVREGDAGGAGHHPQKNGKKEPTTPLPPAEAVEAVDEPESVPEPASVPEPEPELDLGPAAAFLHGLGRSEPRLRLGIPEALKLAPLAAAWFADGATRSELHHALTSGLPVTVTAPAGLLKHRLVQKRPPAATLRPDPAPTTAPVRHECSRCDRPVPRMGLCRLCAAEGGPTSPPPATEGTVRGAALVRAALRGLSLPALPA